MKRNLNALLLCTLALIFSCVSAPEEKAQIVVISSKSPEQTINTEAVQKAASTSTLNPEFISQMKELLNKGEDAFYNGQTVEGIKSFVSVLATFEAANTTNAEAQKLRDEANLELTKIGTALRLEPGKEWIDAQGKQISGSARNLGKESALNPNLTVWLNFGGGELTVKDAPLFFEFVKNSGSLNQLVSTDTQGRANSIISEVANPGQETVIRVYPLFRVKGFTYAFKSVMREFTYLPPAMTAGVIVYENSEFGTSASSQTADFLGQKLKNIGLDVQPFNASDLEKVFLSAFSGDAESVRLLSRGSKISYFALVYTDCYQIKQVSYNGKTFELYTAQAKSTMRIVREDGTLLFTIPLDSVKSDGNSRESAKEKVFKVAREKLLSELDRSLSAIKSSIEKE